MFEETSKVLAHHGVKGMKWGVRKSGAATATVSTKTGRLARPAKEVVVRQRPGSFVKTTGGTKHIADTDAIKVAATRQFAKKSTTDAIATKDLKEAVARMQLEQQYHKLVKAQDRRTRGKRMIDALLGNKNAQKQFAEGAGQAAKVAGTLKRTSKAAVKVAAISA